MMFIQYYMLMQLTLYATLLSTMQEAIVGNGIFRHRFFSP